ncbi:MAG: helix-turn-helix domain-containing protein, partial [Streptosporangiaceae bacterium]
MNEAVERAAQCIWESYGEPLSHTEIARSAMLSRFHFARLFRESTGVTPCRFLAAVRIYQAKHMLVTTKTSVTDISFAVGYNSMGSFINHFTRSVGFSPRRFRQLALEDRFELPGVRPEIPTTYGGIAGTLTLPDGLAGAQVYV